MNRVTHIENGKGPTPKDVDPRRNARAAAAKEATRPELTNNSIGFQHARPVLDPAVACAVSAFEAHRTTVGIAPKAAAHLAGVSQQTIIRWIAKYSIGYKVAGRYIVDRERLSVLMVGGIQ